MGYVRGFVSRMSFLVIDSARKIFDFALFLFDFQTGHSTLLEADPREAFRAYTKASELGSAVGQYKLGFLYGSNYGDAIRDEGRGEGEGSQGSVCHFLLYELLLE